MTDRSELIALCNHAAHQATAAATELLRFACEDQPGTTPEADVVALLTDALRLAIGIETATDDRQAPLAAEHAADLNQLQGAVVRFLDRWGD